MFGESVRYTREVRLGMLLLLVGCDRILGLDKVDPPPGTNGSGDASPDTANDSICYGIDFHQVCLPAHPTGNLEVPASIDTTACLPPGIMRQTTDITSVSVCVFDAGTTDVQTPVIVTGANPLVLIAADLLNVDSSIVVAAAADSTDCMHGADNGATGVAGAGGAGGSFVCVGGSGGNASNVGGQAEPIVGPVLKIRGGCAGGMGGGDDNFGVGGPGGKAGGALYLIAGAMVSVTAAVRSGGAGGSGGGLGSTFGGGGGGGGGTGGMIGIDAPHIALGSGALLCANGGGGGGGAESGASGTDGADGCASGLTAAAGGASASGMGSGGAGSTQSDGVTGEGNAASVGGGGGGGGAGAILFHSQSVTGPTTSCCSPTPATN
jgi:hypothetical protein